MNNSVFPYIENSAVLVEYSVASGRENDDRRRVQSLSVPNGDLRE